MREASRAKGQRDDVLEHSQSQTYTDLGFIVSSTGVEEVEKNHHDVFLFGKILF